MFLIIKNKNDTHDIFLPCIINAFMKGLSFTIYTFYRFTMKRKTSCNVYTNISGFLYSSCQMANVNSHLTRTKPEP